MPGDTKSISCCRCKIKLVLKCLFWPINNITIRITTAPISLIADEDKLTNIMLLYYVSHDSLYCDFIYVYIEVCTKSLYNKPSLLLKNMLVWRFIYNLLGVQAFLSKYIFISQYLIEKGMYKVLWQIII